MNKCKECGSTEVVYSGVDAFCLGVQVGEYCYPCANGALARIFNVKEGESK